MNKRISIFILMALLFVMLAGCAPGSGIQVNTPIPNKQTGEPASGDKIVFPGVVIDINAPGPNPLVNTADANGRVAGILLGIWHGIISPITLVLSFINKDVYMYEVHNDGSPYNLGFLLGFIVLLAVFIGIGSRR